MVISALDSGGPSRILARCKTTNVESFSLRSQNLTVLFKGMITLGNSSATNSVFFCLSKKMFKDKVEEYDAYISKIFLYVIRTCKLIKISKFFILFCSFIILVLA